MRILTSRQHCLKAQQTVNIDN